MDLGRADFRISLILEALDSVKVEEKRSTSGRMAFSGGQTSIDVGPALSMPMCRSSCIHSIIDPAKPHINNA